MVFSELICFVRVQRVNVDSWSCRSQHLPMQSLPYSLQSTNGENNISVPSGPWQMQSTQSHDHSQPSADTYAQHEYHNQAHLKREYSGSHADFHHEHAAQSVSGDQPPLLMQLNMESPPMPQNMDVPPLLETQFAPVPIAFSDEDISPDGRKILSRHSSGIMVIQSQEDSENVTCK